MTAPRKPSVVLPVAVTLGLLLGLYVLAYYAMVVPPYAVHGASGGVGWSVRPFLGVHVPMWFFTPIYRVDRRIRPHVWEPTPRAKGAGAAN